MDSKIILIIVVRKASIRRVPMAMAEGTATVRGGGDEESTAAANACLLLLLDEATADA